MQPHTTPDVHAAMTVHALKGLPASTLLMTLGSSLLAGKPFGNLLFQSSIVQHHTLHALISCPLPGLAAKETAT